MHKLGILLLGFAVGGCALNLNAASTLHIGFGAATLCATGCGGDPNTNENTLSFEFDVYQNSGGAKPAVQPVLLILGVAGFGAPVTSDPGTFSQSSITALTSYNPYNAGNLSNGISYPSTAWQYGSTAFGVHGTATPGAGFQGYFSSGEIYSFLNLTSAGLSNSQSFTNWNSGIAAYSPRGPRPTGYSIYVFALNAPLNAHGLVNITFGADSDGKPVVPAKTYLLAYAQDAKGKPFGVPFTEGALQTPEPLGWVLMSTVCVVLFGAKRLQQRKAKVTGPPQIL